MCSNHLSGESIGVVGAGFGGLTAAAYLADTGTDATVYEKQPRAGGVASVIEADGFRFDTGPSWYLMPGLFERFFRHFGYQLTDYYESNGSIHGTASCGRTATASISRPIGRQLSTSSNATELARARRS